MLKFHAYIGIDRYSDEEVFWFLLEKAGHSDSITEVPCRVIDSAGLDAFPGTIDAKNCRKLVQKKLRNAREKFHGRATGFNTRAKHSRLRAKLIRLESYVGATSQTRRRIVELCANSSTTRS